MDPQGLQGLQNLQGLQGPQGPQVLQVLQGLQGLQGLRITVGRWGRWGLTTLGACTVRPVMVVVKEQAEVVALGSCIAPRFLPLRASSAPCFG